MLNNEQIHQVFLSLPLPVLLIEPRGEQFIIVEANAVFLEQISATREELIGKESLKAFPGNLNNEADISRIQHSFKEVILKKEPSIIECLTYLISCGNDGEIEKRYWHIENHPVVGPSGEVDLIIHISKDITDQELGRQRKETESLRQQQVSDFLEENIDALFSLDPQGNFTSANNRILEALETTSEELIGTNFIPFCAPEDKATVLDNFNSALSGNPTKFEGVFYSLNEQKMILQIALMPFKLNNRIEGVYGFAKDMTGLRQTEKVVLEKKKFLEVNAAFINALVEKDLDYNLLEKAFSIIGKGINVDRISYFESHLLQESGEVVFSKKLEWNSEQHPGFQNTLELQNLPLNKMKLYLPALFENKPFIAYLSEMREGLLKQSLIENKIKSLLLLPIFLEGKLYGYISFVDSHLERQWTEDLPFLQAIEKNLTNSLEKKIAEEKARIKEDQLRTNEQRFRALVQEGSDLMAILDADGKYSFISATVYTILGIQPEELLGKNVFDFVHPEDRENLKRQFEEVKQSKKKKVSPFRYSDKNGNWIWLETTATNLLHEPAVQGIVVNSRDVTTILEQAREIEHMNERYRLAAMATQDIIYDWDLTTGQVQRHHNAPNKLFGFSEKEVRMKKFWRSHIHTEDLEGVEKKISSAIENPKENFINTKYRFQRADGTYALVLDKSYIVRDLNDQAIRIIGASSDVSDIKAKEEALRIANDRFKLAMDATNEMIYDWDVSADVMIRSKAFETIYGYSLDENYPPNSFWFSRTIVQDQGRVRKSLEQALANKDQYLWREEYAVLRADNSVAHVIDRASLLRNAEGKVTRMVGAVLDVTQSLQLLQEVQKQNEILREIAWEQSHVVRAPLARLKGLIYLLELQGFEEVEEQKILEHITASAEELDEIVKGIVAKTEKLG